VQFISDEIISIAAGATTTLTRSKIDNSSGGPRARLAVVHNHNLGSTLALRVGAPPNSSTYEYLPLAGGQAVNYEGYDNLVDLQIKNIGNTVTAKVFVQYFA
jgi:hypothetical protein